MKTKFHSLILIAALFATSFVACSSEKEVDINSSNVANTKITLHNLEEVSNKLAEAENISTRDIELFVNALTRLGSEKDSIVGKTVSEIVASQKRFLKDRASEVLRNSGARISLFLNHTFKYVGIQFNDEDPQNKINNIVFEVLNTSDKPIKKLEGRLQFYTQAGELVKIYNLSTATEISENTNKPLRFSMPFKYDDNSQRDQIIRNSKNLNAVWTPTTLEFSDGTKIIDKATLNDNLSN